MLKTYTFDLADFYKRTAPFQFERPSMLYFSGGQSLFHQIFQNHFYVAFREQLIYKGYDFLNNFESAGQVEETLGVFQYFKPELSSIVVDTTDLVARLLDFFGISETSDTFFLYAYGYTLTVVLITPNNVERYGVADIVQALQNSIPVTNYVLGQSYRGWDDALYAPIQTDLSDWDPDEHNENYNLELDAETKSLVDDLQSKLQRLGATGQFLFALPLIEKKIQEVKAQSKVVLSPLYIDTDYRIFLTAYGNKEVHLSHLTKALYFLYLKEPEIHVADLKRHKEYKDVLFTIYKHISHQENLDRMEEAVDKLLYNTNEVYVHFSRIKSAFCKVMSEDIAQHYYIKGGKNKPKKIDLDYTLHNIAEHRKVWFPNNMLSINGILTMAGAFERKERIRGGNED